MSSRRYPRVVDAAFQFKWRDQRAKAGKKFVEHHLCVVCGAPATHKVFVQVNWFRGDDEGPFKACADHKQDGYALLGAQEKKAPTNEVAS